jgi:hypothetical protein
MINNERIDKLKQRLKDFQIPKKEESSSNSIKLLNNRRSSFEDYRNEQNSSSSSCSSISIESFHQSILFLSKAKFYRKYLNWIKIGKGECEILQNNQSGLKFTSFFLS